MIENDDHELMSRAAWIYYVGGLNQEETANRLGTTRARVNKLLQSAKDAGIVSISIDSRSNGLLEVEDRLRQRFNLERCICSPALGLSRTDKLPGNLSEYPRRAVGSLAATLVKELIARKGDAVIGTGWGRTLDQITRNMAGVSAPRARFVSLMGSLTANSAFNPFEVVQALARATGAEGYFLPVPFIANTPRDRDILLSQTTVRSVLEMARQPDMAIISVGELTEHSLLRRSGMISQLELDELHEAGAIGDTNGIFFDAHGAPVRHVLNQRTLAVNFDALRATHTVLLSGGIEKAEATCALLESGIVKTLVVDGDTAHAVYKIAVNESGASA
ncbi:MULTISPECIES: sugar-binding transcriptional regulator [unclassified Nitratireductor]|uniref:sugar-binding transcriptional regulator n=1 Tax=unclassified Nitratireductor TaxID=2641084 RepID=UPI0025CC0CE7|nr:sugar-binding transcriptional regulator [Nitratireductor sp.]